MTTIHDIIKKFKSFPFREKEGLLIIGVDDNAISSYIHFEKKILLLDALTRIFRKNPELMGVCSDALKLASSSTNKKNNKKGKQHD